MTLAQRHTPTQQHATGMLAPIVRAATHVGFLVAVADMYKEDDQWKAELKNVEQELKDTLAHFEDGLKTNVGAFIAPTTIAAFKSIQGDIKALTENTKPKREDFLLDMQVLSHNIAWMACLYEKDLTGEDADEGHAF